MGRRALGWLALVAVSGSFACAANRQARQSNFAASADATLVTVRNDNWLDVVIYVVHGASRFRIGTVRSMATETFRLTSEGATAASPLRLMADPIGAATGYVTEPIVLGPGQRVDLRVGSPISISTFSIWNQ